MQGKSDWEDDEASVSMIAYFYLFCLHLIIMVVHE